MVQKKKGFPKWIRSGEKRQLAADKQWIAWSGRFRMITGICKHLRKVYHGKAKNDLSYFQSRGAKFYVRSTLSIMFSSATQQKSDGTRASHNIFLLLTKSVKLHTVGRELILASVIRDNARLINWPMLYETTLSENESSLLAYLRDVKEEKLSEQLQFARYMEKDTTGQSIFLVVAEGFKEKGISLRNLINAVADGDLEMAY
ncbi:conserved hypothetical protein [Trichinella spiralis]|uniref:hypothetical protein n=1 Tax=Trichinella spiralis TaxID=6334 RepID=UPI0001EFDBBD|nr:conserved hypothetical protein [Trichinella spiralis]